LFLNLLILWVGVLRRGAAGTSAAVLVLCVIVSGYSKTPSGPVAYCLVETGKLDSGVSAGPVALRAVPGVPAGWGIAASHKWVLVGAMDKMLLFDTANLYKASGRLKAMTNCSKPRWSPSGSSLTATRDRYGWLDFSTDLVLYRLGSGGDAPEVLPSTNPPFEQGLHKA